MSIGGDFSPNMNLHVTIHSAVSRLLVGRFFLTVVVPYLTLGSLIGALISYLLSIVGKTVAFLIEKGCIYGRSECFNHSLATQYCLSARQNVKFIDLEYVSCH